MLWQQYLSVLKYHAVFIFHQNVGFPHYFNVPFSVSSERVVGLYVKGRSAGSYLLHECCTREDSISSDVLKM